MAKPHDVLEQLLSESQADILTTIGDSSWQTITRVLDAVMDSAPALDSAEGRLVMPDEIAGSYADRHLAIPVHLSAHGQESIAYITLPTASIAAFFEIDSDNPADEEGQVIAVGGPLAAQVVQNLNSSILRAAPGGMALELGTISADTMAATLEAMDEPALYLRVRFGGLECALVLPGTFLDVLATALPESAVKRPVRPGLPEAEAAASGMPFSLTAEEIEAAELIELPLRQQQRQPELVGAAAGPGTASVVQNLRNQVEEGAGYGREQLLDPATGLPPRPPTPISNAPTAQRARFAPLPENDPPPFRGNMDLLSSLQMNVTVELGRTQLTVAEVLALGSGSVIELERLAGEPVDILVNDRIIARGEVVVVDENFGVRVVEVLRRGETEERAS